VRHLSIHECLRDNADHIAPRGEDRIGDYSHQADARASVNERELAIDELPSEVNGRLAIGRIGAWPRPREDTQPLHAAILGGRQAQRR
jgi:hypothetical protein